MSTDRETVESARFAEALQWSPDDLCPAHHVPEVVIAIRWYEHSGIWPERACTRDFLYWHGFDDMFAVWDGEQWQTEGVEAAWRDALCFQSGQDRDRGRIIWDELEGLVDLAPPDWQRRDAARGAWALVMQHPEMPVSRAWTLVAVAQTLHEGGGLVERGDAVELAALVDGSRTRWETYHAALWSELSPVLRGRALALGDGPIARHDFDRLPTADVLQFDEVADAVEQEHPLPWRDHRAWAPQQPSQNLTQERLRGLIRWLAETGVAVDATDDPAIQPEPPLRPVFGPNSDAVADFLAEAASLDDLTLAFMRVALPLQWAAEPAPPAGITLYDAWRRTESRIDRLLMHDALDAVYASGAGSWWWDWRSHRGESIHAIWFAALATLMRGLMDQALAETLVAPYDRARASAERVRQAGPSVVKRALELAEGWSSGPEELAEAALDLAPLA